MQKSLEGKYGTAKLTEMDAKANLATWRLNLPGQHAFWSNYQLSVVHLRDEPGLRPPVKHFEAAEYEIFLMAISNEGHMLQPGNMVYQFAGATDEGAKQVANKIAEALVHGQLPAEPQGLRGAQEVWANKVALFISQANEEDK